MRTKYVYRGLISLYVIFRNNWTMWSTNLHAKICKWGGGEGKRAVDCSHVISLSKIIHTKSTDRRYKIK